MNELDNALDAWLRAHANDRPIDVADRVAATIRSTKRWQRNARQVVGVVVPSVAALTTALMISLAGFDLTVGLSRWISPPKDLGELLLWLPLAALGAVLVLGTTQLLTAMTSSVE